MNPKSIVLYLHVHQPFRIRHYSVFDIASKHDYFNADYDSDQSNQKILEKIAHKSYIPTNNLLLEILKNNPDFRFSLSITGTLLEQLQKWAPEVLESFKELVDTSRVEIVAETYHHSLAFFYSKREFETQVQMHTDLIKNIFNKIPTSFRNTELSYNNDLAYWADLKGYKAIITEGWDPVLNWRSPNYVYKPSYSNNIKLLLKNYKLSDDIAFRFGDRNWSEWPLTADKFCHWISDDPNGTNVDLFMDYETFGEHQWQESGIFDFLRHLPSEWMKTSGHNFKTITETADSFDPVDSIDVPNTITWADTERDLSAWLGNSMQSESIKQVYSLEDKILQTNDLNLIEDWRKLQTSDNFYYMSTKYWNDGDIHSYFSPYKTPYEAYISFMNVYHDILYRIAEHGIEI
jgi:alpha-amylase